MATEEHGSRRFIPAGAGNTNVIQWLAASSSVYPRWRGNTHIASHEERCRTVYPRWRGEHSLTAFCIAFSCGLSPLARGTQQIANIFAIQPRFIPAGAGNTISRPATTSDSSVYPRWRGEHTPIALATLVPPGLSPLARGTRQQLQAIAACIWFIPAGAGNTGPAFFCICCMTVYPRWRGEHESHVAVHTRERGLSPLARGTRSAY